MTDPRNTAIRLAPSGFVENFDRVFGDHGKSVDELAAEQAADHKRRVADRVLAKQKEAARKEHDELYARIFEEVRHDLTNDKSCRNDVVGEASFGREQRIVDAWLLGDNDEVGVILSEGMTAEFMGIVSRRVKAAS